MKSLFQSEKVKELIRFGIVGVLATAAHYLIYYILLSLGIPVGISYTVGYIISWLGNFWLTAHFTFKEKTSVKRGVGFAFSHGINYLMQMVCLNIFVRFGIPAALAPIPVYGICIPVNFLLVRFVFKNV